jgi:hypothetical protein
MYKNESITIKLRSQQHRIPMQKNKKPDKHFNTFCFSLLQKPFLENKKLIFTNAWQEL